MVAGAVVAEIEASCGDLISHWENKNYERCLQILNAILRQAPQPQDINAVARVLLGLKLQLSATSGSSSESIVALQRLRADVLARAAAQDNALASEVIAANLAARESIDQWMNDLAQYVSVQSTLMGICRDRIWEITVLIHWGLARLVSCKLDESTVIRIFYLLQHVNVHLNWQHAGASMTKTMLREEQAGFAAALYRHVLRLAQEGNLSVPEHFIRFDADGRLESTLADIVLNVGIRQPDSIALLYALSARGNIPRPQFLAQLFVGQQRCFIPFSDRILISCGEVPIGAACQTIQEIQDPLSKEFRLCWWLDVNFPSQQLADTSFVVSRVPAFVRALLKGDQADIFLSASGELSRFSADWVNWLESLTKALECQPRQIVYLPQNSRFREDYFRFRQDARTDEGPRIAPLNSHLVIPKLLATPPVASAPSKKFICFNLRPHRHRVALALSFYRDGMLGDTHMSFNDKLKSGNLGGLEQVIRGSALAEWMKMPASDIDRLIDDIEPLLPLRLDLRGQNVGTAADGDYINSVNSALFADAAVYLVTETEMDDSSVLRCTEKTVKGLASMIPFIIFGCYGSLAYLKSMGFRTFSPLIDESYDMIEDPVARFHAAYGEVRRLHAMPLADLVAMRQALIDVLSHNRQHLTEIGSVIRGHLERALTDGGRD